MLIKGKRTFTSFMTAISSHISEDWLPEDDDESLYNFGEDWAGMVVMDPDDDVIYGIELFNAAYTEEEIVVVEKAISLLEGIKWSPEAAEQGKKVRKRRARKEEPEEEGVEE